MPQTTIATECEKVSIFESEAIAPANGGSRLLSTEPARGFEMIGMTSSPPDAQPSWMGNTDGCLKPFPDESCRAFGLRGSLTELMGTSPQIQKVIEAVGTVARSPFAVLIEGETGTGKELIARAIHCLSARPAREFVAVDCGAIPETLIESELFGYEKGPSPGHTSERKEVSNWPMEEACSSTRLRTSP